MNERDVGLVIGGVVLGCTISLIALSIYLVNSYERH